MEKRLSVKEAYTLSKRVYTKYPHTSTVYYKHDHAQISFEPGSVPINTLNSLLLSAGPILASDSAPFLFAHFYRAQTRQHTAST